MHSLGSGQLPSVHTASVEFREDPAYMEQLRPEVDFVKLKAEAEALNTSGMQYMRDGRVEDAFQELTRARGLVEQVQEPWGSSEEAEQDRRLLWAARAETYGNLGVVHRKCGEFAFAIQHLEQAVKNHRTLGNNPRNTAAALLNLAACYLESNTSPADALRAAQGAVDLGGQLLHAQAVSGDAAGGGAGDAGGGQLSVDDCAMLAVAYHKVAEAQEGLKEWAKASHAYTQAYEVVRRSLGPHHHLTKAFETSTRCPRHITAPPTLNLPITTPRMLTQPARLPAIPRASTKIPRHNALKYEMGADVFEPWPPKNLSREERSWYRMAKKQQPYRS